MSYLKNKELIDKLEKENTLLKFQCIEKSTINNRWVSMYDLINLFCVLTGFTTKIHKNFDLFEELFTEFLSECEQLKFYERYDYFHLVEIQGNSKQIFTELCLDEDEESKNDWECWNRYDWRDKGISKDHAFAFLSETRCVELFSEFKISNADLLIQEQEGHHTLVKLNDPEITGEYLEDLYNKIEKLTVISSLNNNHADLSLSKTDEELIEFNRTKEALKRLEQKYTEFRKTSGDMTNSPMAKKAVSKLIGALIRKSFPNLTREKGLSTHGLIEAVARESGVDPSVVSKWIEIAQYYETK